MEIDSDLLSVNNCEEDSQNEKNGKNNKKNRNFKPYWSLLINLYLFYF